MGVLWSACTDEKVPVGGRLRASCSVDAGRRGATEDCKNTLFWALEKAKVKHTENFRRARGFPDSKRVHELTSLAESARMNSITVTLEVVIGDVIEA